MYNSKCQGTTTRPKLLIKLSQLQYQHWRQSALNSAGALRTGTGNFGEFSPHFIL